MDIVYVEDEHKVQRQVARFLGAYGHRVRVYDNIEDALEGIIRQPPDILLCDYQLKNGTNGLTLAKKVSTHRGKLP